MDVKVTAVRGTTESSFATVFTATTLAGSSSTGSGGGGALGYGFLLALALLRALSRPQLRFWRAAQEHWKTDSMGQSLHRRQMK
jgi:hypothetical protein